LMVSKVISPLSKSEPARPQPRKFSSSSPEERSAGWL
jgi:hypothetical protein